MPKKEGIWCSFFQTHSVQGQAQGLKSQNNRLNRAETFFHWTKTIGSHVEGDLMFSFQTVTVQLRPRFLKAVMS